MKSNNIIQSFLTINDLKDHIVYEIENLINSKKYIGQTEKTIEERFNGHCKSPYYIGNAIRKHGRENFTIKIIAKNLSREEAGELEKYYIKELNTLAKNGRGYNIAEGGEGGHALAGASEEQKAEWKNNISKSINNKTPEEKVEQKRKELETKANKTPKEKAESIKKRKETTSNKSPEEKNESIKKQLETKANKTPEEKAEYSKNLSEANAFKYSQEETDFILQQKSLGLSIEKITKAFNEKFRKPSDYVGVKAIRNHIKRKITTQTFLENHFSIDFPEICFQKQ